MMISRPRATQLSQIDIDVNLAMGAHDITLGAGRLVDGVDVSAIESYVHDGTLVRDGGVNPTPNPAAWTELDLSAYVGANRALVVLKALNNEAAAKINFAVRPNGDASNFWAGSCNDAAHKADILEQTAIIVVCETDAAGIIEWFAEDVGLDLDITLLGYIR